MKNRKPSSSVDATGTCCYVVRSHGVGSKGVILSSHEPLAIVGMGCRFQGVPNVESFWRVLQDGIETVGDYSETRFDYIDRVYSAASANRGLDCQPSGRICTRPG